MKFAAIVGGCLALACLLSVDARAQSAYPDKPIRVITPTTAGGPLDLLTRILGQGFQAKWGQTAVPLARPGGAQNIAAEQVYRSPPDGYTLMLAAPTPYAVNQHLFPKLNYDPTGFIPISVLLSAPNFLMVRNDLPAKSLVELLALAKSKPGGLTYGSLGVGSTPHLTGEAFKLAAGVALVHVPYKGSVDLMQDLAGDRVDLAFINMVDAFPQIAAGRLRALAICSDARSPAFADMPALSESFPGFRSEVWFALSAPPETPMAIIDQLHSGVIAAFDTEQAKKHFADTRVTPILNTPAQARDYIRAESERWRKVIVANNITIE